MNYLQLAIILGTLLLCSIIANYLIFRAFSFERLKNRFSKEFLSIDKSKRQDLESWRKKFDAMRWSPPRTDELFHLFLKNSNYYFCLILSETQSLLEILENIKVMRRLGIEGHNAFASISHENAIKRLLSEYEVDSNEITAYIKALKELQEIKKLLNEVNYFDSSTQKCFNVANGKILKGLTSLVEESKDTPEFKVVIEIIEAIDTHDSLVHPEEILRLKKVITPIVIENKEQLSKKEPTWVTFSILALS